VSALDAGVWRLWLHEYGAAGAIRIARSHGYTDDEIRAANQAARAIEEGTTHNHGIKS
jgi:hypothetical protein